MSSTLEYPVLTKSISVNVSDGSDVIIAAPTAPLRIYVTSYFLSLFTGVGNCAEQWSDGGSTALEGFYPAASGTLPASHQRQESSGGKAKALFACSAGNNLTLNFIGTSGTVTGRVTYYLAP